ncbi:MAG: FkbM family methyltransferase [Cyanobacteriota bacterium]|nr:FkbM family methyltransferase [Cyanobacteriota bacterium]
MDTSQTEQLFKNSSLTFVENSFFLRLIYKLFPSVNRLYFTIAKYAQQKGLIGVPWGKYKLFLPSRWLDRFSLSDIIFKEKDATPELAVIQDLIRNLDRGTIVDVGAAIGLYTLHLRQHSKLPIIAYEPSPLAFAVCKKNVEINQLKDVEVRNKACGDENGSIVLDVGINSQISSEPSVPDSSNGGEIENLDDLATLTKESWTKQKVELVKLDEDLRAIARISSIKIDCEGFEYNILAGAKRIIEEQTPILFIELHPQFIQSYGHTIEEICELLNPYYDLEYWDFQQARKMNRYARFLSHYFPKKGYKFASEAEMLNAANTQPIPTQLYLLGYPKQASV